MRYLVPLLLLVGLVGCAPYDAGYPGEAATPAYGYGYAANEGYPYSSYVYAPVDAPPRPAYGCYPGYAGCYPQ
jgi:hypothetical protein